jgi:hypothetical protein
MYQLEKEDGSEFSATVIHGGVTIPNSASSSKMNITGQQIVRLIFLFSFNINLFKIGSTTSWYASCTISKHL